LTGVAGVDGLKAFSGSGMAASCHPPPGIGVRRSISWHPDCFTFGEHFRRKRKPVKTRAGVGLGAVAVQILSYLSRHRDARDTLEGIAEWWLLEQHVRRVMTEVQKAITELLAQGLVLERTAGDGRVHYWLNPRKRRIAARVVGQASSDPAAQGCDPSTRAGRRRR
jgi:hypothetical protein